MERKEDPWVYVAVDVLSDLGAAWRGWSTALTS